MTLSFTSLYNSIFSQSFLAQDNKVAKDNKANKGENTGEVLVPRSEERKLHLDSTGLITVGVVNENNRLKNQRVTDGVLWGDFAINIYKNFFFSFNGGIAFPEPLNGTISRGELTADRPVDSGTVQNFALGIGYVNQARNSAIMVQAGKINNMLNPLQALNEHITWTKDFNHENYNEQDHFRLFRSTLGPIPESEDTSTYGGLLRGGYYKGILSIFTTFAVRQEPLRDVYKAQADYVLNRNPLLSPYINDSTSDNFTNNYRISWDIATRFAFLEAGLNFYYGRFDHPYKLRLDYDGAGPLPEVYETQSFLVRGLQARVGLPIKIGPAYLKPAYVYSAERVVENRSYDYPIHFNSTLERHFGGAEFEFNVGKVRINDAHQMPISLGVGYFYQKEEEYSNMHFTPNVQDNTFHRLTTFFNMGSYRNLNLNLTLRTDADSRFSWTSVQRNFSAALAFTINTDFVGDNVPGLNTWLQKVARDH